MLQHCGLVVVIGVISGLPLRGHGQHVSLDSLDKPQRRTHDIIRFADAVVYTVGSPIRWKGKDCLKAGVVISGTALLTLIDEPVMDFWQDRNSGVWDGIERAGFYYGKPYAVFGLTSGFYLTGVLLNYEWARETGLILGAAYLTSGTIQTLMKSVVGRARPGTNVGPWAFDPFTSDPRYHSFPSGHMQVAMVTAMVLAERLNPVGLKILFYGTAGLTLSARLYSDAHWFSDLVFGGVISWFCTKAVIKSMETNKFDNPLKRKDKISWSITPSFQGIRIVGRF
jgi:membrane-associated phospholipid phosphatase